jgi:hypothetical protein
MNGGKTVGPLALRLIGEALKMLSHGPRRHSFRLGDLIAQFKRATKEDDYRLNAVELMRMAEHAGSPAERARLVALAERWIELAGKAHEDNQRDTEPTILHPLVQKKMGKLPD